MKNLNKIISNKNLRRIIDIGSKSIMENINFYSNNNCKINIRYRIDGVTLMIKKSPDIKKIYKRIDEVKSKGMIKVKRSFKKNKSRLYKYTKVFSINKTVVLRIQWEPYLSKNSPIRIEIKNQHLDKKGFKRISNLFLKLGLGKYIKESFVSRLDFAVDIYSYNLLDKYVPSLFRSSTSKVYLNHLGKTLYLGSSKSLIQICIYPKYDADLLSNKQIKYLNDLDPYNFSEYAQQIQYAKFIRFEFRLRPLKDKVLLVKMESLKGIFDKLEFYEINSIENQMLLELIQIDGCPKAMKSYKNTMTEAQLKKLKRGLEKSKVQVFDIEVIKKCYVKSLKKLCSELLDSSELS